MLVFGVLFYHSPLSQPCSEVVHFNPRLTRSLLLRSEAYRSIGNDGASRRDLQRAIRAGPGQPWPYLYLGYQLLARDCTKVRCLATVVHVLCLSVVAVMAALQEVLLLGACSMWDHVCLLVLSRGKVGTKAAVAV